jgi:GNAT superfamily N-acetyltransferase
MADLIELRWSREADAEALAALHRDAWAHAYAGIIPGPALLRMTSLRGPRWWRAVHRAGERALVVDLGAGPVGYARMGPARGGPNDLGEIYELYLRPECQGIGFGAARRALVERGRRRLLVWALAENEAARRFYRAMGGALAGRAKEHVGGRTIAKVAFLWTR